MTIQKEDFAGWLRNEELNSPQDIYSWGPYKITTYEVNGPSVYVEYEFLTVDPYVDQYEMFEMCEKVAVGNKFPKFINKIKFKERYTWDSEDQMHALTQDYLRDHIDLEYENIPWDSAELTDDIVDYVVDRYDRSMIGAALVEIYNADKKMPDFVPARLYPQFEICVQDYLKER